MTQADSSVGGYFKWLGIVLIVLGVIAILAPALAGSSVVVMIGIILLFAGASSAVRGMQAATGREKALGLVLGLVTVLAGGVVVVQPVVGLAFLTLLLAGYFIAEGIFKIVMSLRYRPTNGWGWLLTSGLLSLILGALIWSQWPMSGLWAVGVLVGVNLLGTGLALLTLVSVLGKAADRIASPASAA